MPALCDAAGAGRGARANWRCCRKKIAGRAGARRGLGLGLRISSSRCSGLPRMTRCHGHDRSKCEVAATHATHWPTHWPTRLHVYGWTEHMEQFIAAADVVVGKPGGLTVAEVLACGRPLLVTRSLHGQESFNVRFLEREDVGRFVGESELAGSVVELLQDPAGLADMQRRAWATGQRDGATRVAAAALGTRASSAGPLDPRCRESSTTMDNTSIPAVNAGSPHRRFMRATLEKIDDYYRQQFELRPVGPLLYLGLEQHRGAACPLYDGTRLEPGSWIGRLHFNNTRAADLQASGRLQAGVRFARLLAGFARRTGRQCASRCENARSGLVRRHHVAATARRRGGLRSPATARRRTTLVSRRCISGC